MASAIYPSAKLSLANGTLNWTSTAFNVALLNTATYTYSTAHNFFDDVLSGEVVADGYTHTGTVLVSQAITESPAGTAMFDAVDLTWPTSTITSGAAVIYLLRGGAHSADDLVAYVDFGENKVSTAADFKVQWSATGVCTLT
jgi:hypothetical protein